MKTPFVADLPNILVIHARDAICATCKAASSRLGMPVRFAADMQTAMELIPSMRPLALVCDEHEGIVDASAAAHIASKIDAIVVQLDGTESLDEVTERLRNACTQAEAKRRQR